MPDQAPNPASVAAPTPPAKTNAVTRDRDRSQRPAQSIATANVTPAKTQVTAYATITEAYQLRGSSLRINACPTLIA